MKTVNTDTFLKLPPDDILIPDWTHLGVETEETRKISFEDIYIDDVELNRTKEEPHSGADIEDLRMSFSTGVDLNQFTPAVRVRSSGITPYELVYGYGRVAALQNLNQSEWYFSLLKGSEKDIEFVKAQENEGLPKRFNKEVDMRRFLLNMIEKKYIESTETDIRAAFDKAYPKRPKSTKDKVVASIMAERGIKSEYIIYPSKAHVVQWLKNHSTENYCIGGEYDEQRDMYGSLMKESYQYRVVLNAAETFAKTGKKTYVVMHCNAPTEKRTLELKRRQISEEFKRHRENLMSCGLTEWPIVEMGHLPQIRGEENIKELIPPYTIDD